MVSVKDRLLIMFALFVVVLGGIGSSPPRTAEAQVATVCYTVADGGDALWRVDRMSGASTRIGPLGGSFSSVEAIALNLDATVLYAAHDNGVNGVFGTISMSTGVFTVIGPAIGPGSGVNRTTGQPVTASLQDVDSLSMHPLTGDMWAITHEDRANKIFRINTNTGRVIPNTFGPGLDYVQILLPHPPDDVDDLGIDPLSGRFYIIGNSSGVNDRLYELNINGINPPASPGLDATLGTLTVVEIGPLFDIDTRTNIIDMEGFSFFNDGSFYGTTGDQSGELLRNRLWQIDPRNGQASSVTQGEIDRDGVPPYDNDFESVACQTAGSNIKAGIVFEDLNGNGTFDGSDVPQSGVTVNFYRDNGNGSFDNGDTRVQTVVTDGSGRYTFEVAVEGLFFAVLDQATLPAGSTLTTVGSFNVNFADYDNGLVNNHFGFQPEGDETPTPTPTPTPDPTQRARQTPTAQSTWSPQVTPSNPGDPGIVKIAQPQSAVPGETVTFTITVTNGNQSALSGVTVTDTLDAAFFDVAVEASTTKGTVTTNGLSVSVAIGDLAPSEAVLIVIQARVHAGLTGPAETENVAFMTSNEHDPLSARALVGLVRLPSTGYPPASNQPASGLPILVLGMALVVVTTWWVRARRRA